MDVDDASVAGSLHAADIRGAASAHASQRYTPRAAVGGPSQPNSTRAPAGGGGGNFSPAVSQTTVPMASFGAPGTGTSAASFQPDHQLLSVGASVGAGPAAAALPAAAAHARAAGGAASQNHQRYGRADTGNESDDMEQDEEETYSGDVAGTTQSQTTSRKHFRSIYDAAPPTSQAATAAPDTSQAESANPDAKLCPDTDDEETMD